MSDPLRNAVAATVTNKPGSRCGRADSDGSSWRRTCGSASCRSRRTSCRGRSRAVDVERAGRMTCRSRWPCTRSYARADGAIGHGDALAPVAQPLGHITNSITVTRIRPTIVSALPAAVAAPERELHVLPSQAGMSSARGAATAPGRGRQCVATERIIPAPTIATSSLFAPPSLDGANANVTVASAVAVLRDGLDDQLHRRADTEPARSVITNRDSTSTSPARSNTDCVGNERFVGTDERRFGSEVLHRVRPQGPPASNKCMSTSRPAPARHDAWRGNVTVAQSRHFDAINCGSSDAREQILGNGSERLGTIVMRRPPGLSAARNSRECAPSFGAARGSTGRTPRIGRAHRDRAPTQGRRGRPRRRTAEQQVLVVEKIFGALRMPMGKPRA